MKPKDKEFLLAFVKFAVVNLALIALTLYIIKTGVIE